MADKFALIIGNSRYDDSKLSRLKAPDADVRELERVLKSPDVGQFTQVHALINEDCATVRKAVARFYDQRKRDDLLLLYFSGHGVKDDQGHLYLALRDTEIGLLAGTAIESAFVSARMDRSFSKRQVLVLDCCHSGAFAHGTKAAQGASVGTSEAFEGTGLGRVILTATDAMQYAWDGDRVDGDAPNSVFTRHLIDGLSTGAADHDADGVVTVDELYDYVREQVLNTTPRQTPHKWSYQQQGEIVLARNPFVKPVSLPAGLDQAMASPSLDIRLTAVQKLTSLLHGQNVGQSQAALAALKALSQDDSRKVASAAIDVLKSHEDDRRGRRVGLSSAPESNGEGSAGRQPAVVSPGDDRPENRPSDVFISYARQDREKAKALASVLGARGWTIWWDRKIAPGESFDKAIEMQLRTCKCAIVLWSAHSVDATWVRNEARRAARRNVLIPILIEPVETPLEFENLQAADLTTWEAPAEHFELQTLFDRIQELAGVPHDHRARTAVERARREFAAGRPEAALAGLAEFKPAHALVTAALGELREEVERIAREQAARRLAEETAQRERALADVRSRIEELLAAAHIEEAGRALEAAEAQFGTVELVAVRERWTSLQAQAREDERARTVVETARREFGAGRHQEAVVRLTEFQPTHPLVTMALGELRGEADRIARDQTEAARRADEAAQRDHALAAEQSRVAELLTLGRLEEAGRALELAEALFGVAALAAVREQWTKLQAQTREEERARAAVETARREFEAGRRAAAVATLATFRPKHAVVTAGLRELREEAERVDREQNAKVEEEAAPHEGPLSRRALLLSATAVLAIVFIAWLALRPSDPSEPSNSLPPGSLYARADQPPVDLGGPAPEQPAPAPPETPTQPEAPRQDSPQDQRRATGTTGTTGTPAETAADKSQQARTEPRKEAEPLEAQKKQADEAERLAAAQKAEEARQAQEAERQRRAQEQRAEAERQARRAAAEQAQKEAERAQKEAAAQAEKEAATRFFGGLVGTWTREDEQRAQESRTRTEEVLTLDSSCSGVLVRSVTTYERGFAGWKTVGSPQTARLTISCDATGLVSGDVNSRISRDGATLLLGTSRFVRRASTGR